MGTYAFISDVMSTYSYTLLTSATSVNGTFGDLSCKVSKEIDQRKGATYSLMIKVLDLLAEYEVFE